ncbi:MAG: carotenoid biosynthesis protein [Candidatus Electryonea clarkiae]|nr:carotenoid biosynthesis protein [Candidatus Electryonea clarkiae]MDP8285704.1 carotenoid biosynthesis protein [Candidatus Electryonea clarkiae]
MSSGAIILVSLAAFLVLLMSLDRLLQAFNRPPGKIFDGIQLIVAISGVVVHGILFGGIPWTIKFFLVTITIPALIEIIGIKTGFPYGKYRYTEKAGAVIPGGVPLTVILMWWGLLYVAFNTAIALTNILHIGNPDILIIIITAIAVTLWDLTGDPVAVNAGLWTWEKPGRYYGIPATNFAGWLFTSIIAILAVRIIAGTFPDPDNLSIPGWLIFTPVFLFGILLLNYAGAAKKRGLPLAAWISLCYGLFVLAIFVLNSI